MKQKLKKLQELFDAASDGDKEYSKELVQWLIDWLKPKPTEPHPADDGGNNPPPPPPPPHK